VPLYAQGPRVAPPGPAACRCCALDSFAGVGVVRVALEDCRYLGRRGKLLVDGRDVFDCYVVDCQQAAHEPLSERGLVADVSKRELGHRKAVLILWQSETR